MTAKKSTKRALISSLLILAMCFTMLAGTTFAWFTDSVTSANNIIKSGKLDVSMKWANGKEAVDNAAWTDASTGAIFNYDKWEPGYTEVRHIQIKNEGNLALKYKVQIAANGTVSDLADVIDVYYFDPAQQIADRTALANETPMGTLTAALAGMSQTASGNLLPGAADTITIALKMRETAGNEYQEKSIGTDFSIQLLAAQYTYESDSFDNQYDAAAVWPVSNAEEFAAAMAAANDGDVIDASGSAIGSYVGQTVDKSVTIRNANFTKSTAPDPIYGGNTNSDIEGTTFTKPIAFVGCTFDATDAVYCNTFNEGVTFEDCELNGGWSAIYNNSTKGDVVIKNCTIEAPVYSVNFGGGDGDNTLTIENCNIKGWNSFGDTAFSKVYVKDSTFGKSSGYGTLRFYQDAEVTGCTFTSDFEWIDSNKTGITVQISGCTGLNYATQLFNNIPDGGVAQVANWYVDGNPYDVTATH